MLSNCGESFDTCSSLLTLLVHAHIVPICDCCTIPHPHYLLSDPHYFTLTLLDFHIFSFAIIIVAHLGSLRADLGSVSVSFYIGSV